MTVPAPHASVAQVLLADARRRFSAEARPGSFDTGGYRGEYAVWGSGPPLVFIHGLGDRLESFILPMALLSDTFQCIGYNQPRGGLDGARLRGYTHQGLSEDVFRLMDHLRLDRASLFGSSFGSTIAVRAMANQPERVERGVFQGGFAYRPLSWRARLLASMARFWPGRVSQLPFRMRMIERSHRDKFARREADVWDYFLEQTGMAPIRAFAHWAMVLHQTDIRELLMQVRQPALVLCGDDDPLVGHAHQEYLFQRLPNAVMFQIRECGHFPMFTHPEAVADATRRFLLAPACGLSPSAAACEPCR